MSEARDADPQGPEGDASMDDVTRDGPTPRLRRAGVLLIAFGAGFAIMTIEIAGARVIAPTFGLSAVPWTAVIGVILTALALGNVVGGRWADRGSVPLAAVLAGAGLTAALPVVGVGVPTAAAEFGFVLGALLSALVLFAPPVFALGMTVPYLVRAETRTLSNVGRRTGEVSGAATAGSIVGTFLTGFVLLPLMPLPTLLAATAAALLVLAALSSKILTERPGPVETLVLAVAILAVGVTVRPIAPGLVHARETLYGSIQVVEREWEGGRLVRELIQNGGSSSAEVVATGAPAHPYATLSLDLVAGSPLPDSVLVLGGGALTLPVALTEWAPDVHVDVVELDPHVTEVAKRFFTYGERPRPRIEVTHADARLHLADATRRYDLIYLDVFDHLVTVPWTLVTVEAWLTMRERLTPDGYVMANVLSPVGGPGGAFLRRLVTTMERVFPAVRAYPVSPLADRGVTQNVILVAAANPGALPRSGHTLAVVQREGPPFVDAFAPVEYLQARVFLEGLRWR